MNASIEPSVSIIIPTYNESENIESVLNSFLASEYSNIIEILVVDGNSNDNTREIVANISQIHSKVKLILNPQKIQSSALNLGLEACQGEVFLRADAHCLYADDYVDKCIQTLLNTEAVNVGGAQRFIAKSKFQAGVALAAKSVLGSGGAKYRDRNYNGYVDTVFLGCMWTQMLKEIGGYSNQIVNEDAELNQRLLAAGEEAIYVCSDIKVWYYPRKTWGSLWTQYFKYGRGRYLTGTKHSKAKQLRGQLPFLVVSFSIIWFGIDLFFPAINLYSKELFILGLTAVLGESLRVNLKNKDKFIEDIWRGKPELAPSFINRWFNCAIAIATLPTAHFSGYGYQLIRNKIMRVCDW